MAALLRLRHLHLPSKHPHYIPYSLANRVQEHLRRKHLDFKDGSAASAPPPTLISFTPSPIYTLGRRQTTPLTPSEIDRLTAPLQITVPKPTSIPFERRNPQHQTPPTTIFSRRAPDPYNNNKNDNPETHDTYRDDDDRNAPPVSVRPHILHAPRGGLTTYHGPGQAVLWPVLDFRSPHHRHFSVKCYARLLERTTIEMLRRVFGLGAFTKEEDPGVWVASPLGASSSSSSSSLPPHRASQPPPPTEGENRGETTPRSKIAALGVHLRRHITALGTAINVSTPPTAPSTSPSSSSSSASNDNAADSDEEEASNPWARFVACGLAGRGVTSIAREVRAAAAAPPPPPPAAASATATTTSARRSGGPPSEDGIREVDDALREYGRLGSASASASAPLGSAGGGLHVSRESLVARAWAGVLAGGIGLGEGGVEPVGGAEVMRLMEELVLEAAEAGEEVAAELEYLEGVAKVIDGEAS